MLPRLVAAAVGLGTAATSALADIIVEEPPPAFGQPEPDPAQGYMLWIAAAGAAALCVLVVWRVVRKTGGPGPNAPEQ